MIIGENTDQYNGYEENYDYLFKKRQGAPSPRQQKKAERKANKPAPRPGSLRQRRQDKKAGIAPKKKLIMGNFGLFNKNKKREEAAKAAAAATPDVVTPAEADNQPDTSALDETRQMQEMNSGTEANLPTMSEDNTDAGYPAGEQGEESESGYDDPPSTPKQDAKPSGKSKTSESSGPGVWLGWAFLGITVGVIVYTVYKLDKMEASLPHNTNLHPKN